MTLTTSFQFDYIVYKDKGLTRPGDKMTESMPFFERLVLQKLFARKVIGKHHIRWVTLMRCGWKPHEKGLVKEAINQLLKKGLIMWVKKSEKALAIDPRRIKEVIRCVKG